MWDAFHKLLNGGKKEKEKGKSQRTPQPLISYSEFMMLGELQRVQGKEVLKVPRSLIEAIREELRHKYRYATYDVKECTLKWILILSFEYKYSNHSPLILWYVSGRAPRFFNRDQEREILEKAKVKVKVNALESFVDVMDSSLLEGEPWKEMAERKKAWFEPMQEEFIEVAWHPDRLKWVGLL